MKDLSHNPWQYELNLYHGTTHTPVVEQWLEQEIAQWVNHVGSIR